jgi:hypothetical protein
VAIGDLEVARSRPAQNDLLENSLPSVCGIVWSA